MRVTMATRTVFATTFVFCVFLLLTVGPADANHWHGAGNCSTAVDHGLQHGSSTNDASYFSRIMPAGCGYYKSCVAYNNRTGASTYAPAGGGWFTGVSTMCSAWLGSSYEQSCGAASVQAYTSNWNTVLSPHSHYSHYYGC